MKQILLRLSEERAQFIMDWTADFNGVQNTDRLNYMLDKVPTLTASNRVMTDEIAELKKDNEQCRKLITRYRADLDDIKNAIDTLKNFKGVTL